jgi:soluble lytic murein transglycosylase-like protein
LLESPSTCSGALELRVARSRRRSRTRHARQVGRLRKRRRVARLLLVTLAVAVFALAEVAGPPRSARSLRQAAVPTASRCPVPATLRPAFLAAAQATGVRLGLLAAVARVESRFQEQARSRAGAVGVLQLMPATASALHYDPTEPRANVMAGAVYLGQMLGRFGSTARALAAYNAGPTAVDRLGPVPTAETAAYVARVQATWRAFGGCS